MEDLKKLQELEKELNKLGIKTVLNSGNHIGLHINCADHQLVHCKNGVFSFSVVGDSAFFYTEEFTDVKECTEFINKIASRTLEEINELKNGLWNKLTQ